MLPISPSSYLKSTATGRLPIVMFIEFITYSTLSNLGAVPNIGYSPMLAVDDASVFNATVIIAFV